MGIRWHVLQTSEDSFFKHAIFWILFFCICPEMTSQPPNNSGYDDFSLIQMPTTTVKTTKDSVYLNCICCLNGSHPITESLTITWKRNKTVITSFSGHNSTVRAGLEGRADVWWFQHNLTSIFHIRNLHVNDTDIYTCQIFFRISGSLQLAMGKGTNLTVTVFEPITDVGSFAENDSRTNIPAQDSLQTFYKNIHYIVIPFGIIIMGILVYSCLTGKGSKKVPARIRSHEDQVSFSESVGQMIQVSLHPQSGMESLGSNFRTATSTSNMYVELERTQ